MARKFTEIYESIVTEGADIIMEGLVVEESSFASNQDYATYTGLLPLLNTATPQNIGAVVKTLEGRNDQTADNIRSLMKWAQGKGDSKSVAAAAVSAIRELLKTMPDKDTAKTIEDRLKKIEAKKIETGITSIGGIKTAKPNWPVG
ncbi:MAG: hypothetical protein WCP55_16150 [Lentisphaerota bacterium]